jgi:hypothetical protein
MYTSDYWMNFRNLWVNFPAPQVDAFTKWFYLAQLGFWLHQIVNIHLEERRKDHWQMLSHHLITCALISMSYGMYMTKVGTLILILMDSVDIVFSVSRSLSLSSKQQVLIRFLDGQAFQVLRIQHGCGRPFRRVYELLVRQPTCGLLHDHVFDHP